jgi:hypothetical protein
MPDTVPVAIDVDPAAAALVLALNHARAGVVRICLPEDQS